MASSRRNLDELAPRQREAVRIIHEYHAEHGYAPARVDIAEALGLSGTHYVHEVLEALEAKGAITREKYTARTVRVTPKGLAMAGVTWAKD